MKEHTFIIPSMHNETSAKEVASIINGIEGVKEVDTDYVEGSVHVFFNENKVITDKIKNVINKKGYTIR